MRLRVIVWVLLLVFLAGLLYWRSGAGAWQLHYYAPEEYIARADAFIRSGYLVADCSVNPMRLAPRLDEAPPRERSWYRDSYLAADVERFNADPDGFGWAFVIDNQCQLRGVNPVVHAIDLPFTRRIRWLGNILYNGRGSDAVLRSAERTLTLRKAEKPIPTAREAATQVGSSESVLKEGVVLLHMAGGRSQPGARIFHVGDEVVVHNRVRAQRPEAVRLMGHQLPVGMLVRLETGDWLNLAADAPRRVDETFIFVGGEALEAASAVRRQNERYDRETEDPGLGLVPDPLRDRSSPYLDLVARSVDMALLALPEERADALSQGFDVQLTLKRGVQLALSTVFRQYCTKLRKNRESDEPFAAGMTVMDGLTGEILAFATYPSEEDLAEDPPEDANTRRRLLRNQNLLRHPIGSAGKPFLFAAIADAYPGLLQLEIDGHEPERYHPDILHCEIPTGYQLLAGHAGRIDFRTALEVSCNKYTIELATLALAADLGDTQSSDIRRLIPRDAEVEWPLAGQRSGIWIGGRQLDWAPDLGAYVFREDGSPRSDETTAAARCVGLDRFEQVRYRNRLEILTGAATYRGRLPQDLPEDATRRQLEQSYTTNRYDLEPWRPLLEHLLTDANEEQSWKIRAAAQGISPERVNLAFNQVTRLRGDYVSLLLGGGTSIWTNVQVAEAMSRLVSGRVVEANLIAKILPREDPEKAAPPAEDAAEEEPDGEEARPLGPPLDLAPKAREAVLEGLARVVEGGRGTAKDLRDELAAVHKAFPEDRILLYSKTGSPVIERSVPAATGAALERLVVRGRLQLQGGTVVVRLGDQSVPHRRAKHAGRSDFLDALHAALVDVGFGKSAGWLLPAIRNVVDNLAGDLRSRRMDPEEISGPLVIKNGALRLNRADGLFRSRLARGLGSVYVFSLVRLPGGGGPSVPTPEDLSHPDARVVTVAVHLDVGPGSEVAVGAAEAVLPELVALLR